MQVKISNFWCWGKVGEGEAAARICVSNFGEFCERLWTILHYSVELKLETSPAWYIFKK